MPYSVISNVQRSLLTLVLAFIMTAVSPQSVRSDQRVKSYCLGNAYEACFVYIDGTITKDIADQLSDMASGIDAPAIYLNSPGGDFWKEIKSKE